jgi:hypothetical protein
LQGGRRSQGADRGRQPRSPAAGRGRGFALILSPSLSSKLFPAIVLPSLVGALSLAPWFL